MADSLSIAQRLDRLPVTPLHIAFLALGAFGLFADIAEVALSNAFSGIFLAPPYNVSRSELSLLLASVFAGGALGAPAFGWLADRYGRQIALQLALAVLAAAVLGFGFSFPWSSVATTVLRQTPDRERGSVVGVLSAFVDLFVGISSFSAGMVAKRFGYSAAFLMAAVALGAAAIAGRFVFSDTPSEGPERLVDEMQLVDDSQ